MYWNVGNPSSPQRAQMGTNISIPIHRLLKIFRLKTDLIIHCHTCYGSLLDSNTIRMRNFIYLAYILFDGL